MYKNHPDYAGEVDHVELVKRLVDEFDGWVLHTSSVAIPLIASLVPKDVRWMAWVKPFCAFKRNVSVAYAWEPVIVKAARKPTVNHITTMRDWFSHPIEMKAGLTGVKPEAVCHWLFEVVGADPSDALEDLFPGTGAVSMAWDSWRQLRSQMEMFESPSQMPLTLPNVEHQEARSVPRYGG